MKKVLGGLGLFTILAFFSLAVSVQAATVSTPKRAVTPRYDASKEVTLGGTVSSVKKVVPGKLSGGHLFLATSSGSVDAHLGPYALRGSHAIPVTSGQKVTLVGVMTTVKGSKVFLVRTIKSGDDTYTIRNEHGFPLLLGAAPASKSLVLSAKGGAR